MMTHAEEPTILDFDTLNLNLCPTRILDSILVAALALPALVLIGAAWVLYRLTIRDNGPFLYCGLRLGKNRKAFTIYKIRTLIMNAESTIGATVFGGGNGLELWYGGFLRKSRIDELPQLWNILCGTMTFVGPRPERPSIYAQKLRFIPGYDRRFIVTPGLTGYSQFLTPHNTSKKIRTHIDNIFTRSSMGEGARVLFVLWTISRCAYVAVREIGLLTAQRIRLIGNGKFANLRRHRRITVDIAAQLEDSTPNPTTAQVIDISHETLRVWTSISLPLVNNSIKPITMMMNLSIKRNGRVRTNRIQCNLELMRQRQCPSDPQRFEYVFEWSTPTDYRRYMIDKYALKASMA